MHDLRGGIVLETATVSARAFLGAVRDTLAFEAQSRGIEVKLVDRLTEDITLEVNEAALSSALINIGRNALRFTPERGTITLAVELRAKGLLIRCIDEGPGMSEEELARVFDRSCAATANIRVLGSVLALQLPRAPLRVNTVRCRPKNVLPHGLEFEITLPVQTENGSLKKAAV